MTRYNTSPSVLAFLLLLTGSTIHTSTIRFLGGALLVGTSLTVLGQADELQILDDLGQECNISKEDIHSTLSASILAYGIGCLPLDEDTGKAIRIWAFRAPFIAALAGLTSSKTFKNSISKIPGVGIYLGACSNTNCEGSCNKCKIRTTLTTLTIWKYLASRPLSWLESTRIGEYLL